MTSHVEDGALVRHLDHEDDAAERAAVAGHLARCDRCAARIGELADVADAFSAALRAADVPVARARPRSRSRWGLRVAAGLLVFAGVGGLVRPVRAWILERAETLWEAVTMREVVNREVSPPSRSASVAFVPEGDELTVEVTGRQQRGVLRIETASGDTAVAIILDGSGSEDLIVLPRALRIVSQPSSSASYVIRVPGRLTRVRVLVDTVPAYYRPGGAPQEIDLRRQ